MLSGIMQITVAVLCQISPADVFYTLESVPSSKIQIIYFGRLMCIPPEELQRLDESVPRSTEASLVVKQHLAICVGFFFKLSPICSVFIGIPTKKNIYFERS